MLKSDDFVLVKDWFFVLERGGLCIHRNAGYCAERSSSVSFSCYRHSVSEVNRFTEILRTTKYIYELHIKWLQKTGTFENASLEHTPLSLWRKHYSLPEFKNLFAVCEHSSCPFLPKFFSIATVFISFHKIRRGSCTVGYTNCHVCNTV